MQQKNVLFKDSLHLCISGVKMYVLRVIGEDKIEEDKPHFLLFTSSENDDLNKKKLFSPMMKSLKEEKFPEMEFLSEHIALVKFPEEKITFPLSKLRDYANERTCENHVGVTLCEMHGKAKNIFPLPLSEVVGLIFAQSETA